MAEAGLSLAYSDFQRIVARYMGLARDPNNWSANETAEVDDIIQAGYRRFLTPADLEGTGTYEWSFLRPTTTITAWTTVTGTIVGTPSYDSGTNTSLIEATASIFYPSMPGVNFTFDTSSNDYEIVSIVSGTQLRVSGDASGEASGDTLTITATGNYQLSDDFGGIMESLWFDVDSNYGPIVERPEGHILTARSYNDSQGIPKMYGIRAKAGTGTTGQRFELLLYPTPSETYTLTYKYVVLQDKMDAANYPYPLGGAVHAETVLAAIMAEAEWEKELAEGPAFTRYMRRLRSSIQHDMQAIKALRLGYMGDRSDSYGWLYDSSRTSYNGVFYPT